MIAAVLFDLDDTLYPQQEWLDGAWHVVAARARTWGVDTAEFERLLRDVAAVGTDRGGIIDQALALLGASSVPVAPLVAAFRAHAPARLDPYPGAAAALEQLGRRVPLGLVSDGDPIVQRHKLAALGLGPRFATVVLSDEWGRAHRKPDPLPLRRALDDLGVAAADAVYVGDRAAKDVAGPARLGMRAIRVRTGEWGWEPDDPLAWASVDTVVDAIALVGDELDAAASAGRTRVG
ncbi:MAG TPA: HAD family hydrolase [Acidimicrobiia bacterium]|nr:HAD family hydrolase [Acidimicrobiia bacterium]